MSFRMHYPRALFSRDGVWRQALIFSVLLMLFITLAFFIHQDYREKIQLIAAQHIESLDVAYRSTIEMNRLDIHTQFQVLVQRSEVVAMVREALMASADELPLIRGRLYRMLRPFYDSILDQGLRQFQFHLRDDRVLLRFHSPQRADDALFAVRPLLHLANAEQRVVMGWEIGRTWPGYRHIFPLIDANEHLGSVELSMPFERIHTHLLALLGEGDYLFMFHRDQVQQRVDPTFLKHFIEAPIHPDFLVEDPVLSRVTRNFTQSEIAQQLQDKLRDNRRLDRKLQQNKPFVFPVFHEGSAYTVAFLAIPGHLDDTIAFLVHYSPSHLLAKVRSDLYRNLMLTAALIISLALSVIVLLRRQRELQQDIDQRKLTEQSLRLYKQIFEHSGEAILISDHDNRIIAVNPALTQLTGYTLSDLRGKNPRVLSSGHTTAETHRAMWESLLRNSWWQGELWDRRKDGSLYPKWVSISLIRNEAGAITHHIARFTNISERKAKEEQIAFLAHHDPLTGLLNRHSLLDRLTQAVVTAQRQGLELAVLFIDMDRFKWINDSLGHLVGDQLLITIARRLQDLVRESDIVARQGGDEFVVVLTQVHKTHTIHRLAERIRFALAEPYEIDGRILNSSPSMGVAIFPSDGNTPEILLKNADSAMYHAKDQGRNAVRFFTQAMNDAANERIQLEQDLRLAIQAGAFQLHYQPQVYANTGEIYAVEALLRWHHPQQGPISPAKFIPLAEETGLIEPLGVWVFAEACRQYSEWRAKGIVGVIIAVNLSAFQLRSPNLIESVQACLQRYQIPVNAMEFEVTETAAMDDPARSIDCLRKLRNLGIRLAIDDFGTGYSSLAYLKNLPIHYLKLDCSFVAGITHSSSDAAICAATIALAHELSLKVVAEGVETEEQRDFLVKHSCDFLQGYYFGRPAPAGHWSAQWLGTEATSVASGEDGDDPKPAKSLLANVEIN